MSKYKVVIRRIDRKRHSGYGYEIEILLPLGDSESLEDFSWTFTKWGAHRLAKRLVAKLEQPPEEKKIVEEYSL